jgi:hypothetical protein
VQFIQHLELGVMNAICPFAVVVAYLLAITIGAETKGMAMVLRAARVLPATTL